MKVRFQLLGVVAILGALIALQGCNKTPARTDAQLAVEVQNKINADSTISDKAIGVQSENGVVTLSGNVDSDSERVSAASDAATIAGVKTVVNNLVVQQAAEATNTTGPPSTASPARVGKKVPKDRDLRSGDGDRSQGVPATIGNSDAHAGNPTAPPPAQPVAQTPLAPPPPPKKVTIAAGTQLTVRLNDTLDSESNQVGDSFHATLSAPIVIDDETVVPSGAEVVGHIVDVKSAGRFAGNSALTLELTSLSVNGKTYNLQTSQWSRQGKGEGKNTAVKAGGGAALGAIIGGLAGGGKGAAIGSVAGAGAGTGVAATKKGQQIKLPPESTLSFLLINTVTVTQQSANSRNAGRTPLQ